MHRSVSNRKCPPKHDFVFITEQLVLVRVPVNNTGFKTPIPHVILQ